MCCCSGGGLIAGITTYLKNSFSKLLSYSVEPKYYDDMQMSLKRGEIVKIDPTQKTICDALTVKTPGKKTFMINKRLLSGGITVNNGGIGYTTVPIIYIDAPTEEDGIRASLQAVLTDGVLTSVNVLNAGQGYTGTPRVAVIDPTGAQILQTQVDGDGRVTNIELLSGGSGYQDVPSVYIVDERLDGQGNYAGGTNATAVASIFNGQIIDINITNFGSGYSATEPPTIFIQQPPSAEASATVGLNEVTGFTVNQEGAGYSKAKLVGCARAASGIKEYSEDGNAVFSGDTVAAAASTNTTVKCLDALFIKRLLKIFTHLKVLHIVLRICLSYYMVKLLIFHIQKTK